MTTAEKEPDLPEDIRELAHRAEGGDVEAQLELGDHYQWGDGVTEDLERAEYWYSLAASAWDPRGEWELGMLCLASDPERAVRWFLRAADKGHAPGQRSLGLCYARGSGVEQDYGASAAWLTKAAAQGDATATYGLSDLVRRGLGVERDVDEAQRLLERAAEQGYAPAHYELAYRYLKGDGVAPSDQRAFEHAARAAALGNAPAQFLAGWCHATGRGADRDLARAEDWLLRAIESSAEDLRTAALARRWLRIVRFERRFISQRVLGRGILVFGYGMLAFHAATTPFAIDLWWAVGTAVALLAIGLVVVVGGAVSDWLRERRGKEEVLSESGETTLAVEFESVDTTALQILLRVPAEPGAFALPLIYIGLTPWTAAIAALLFGLVHYPSYPVWACIPKSLLYYVLILLLLPKGIWTLIAAHLMFDLLLLAAARLFR